MDIIGLISIVDGDLDDGWLHKDDLTRMVGIDILVIDLEIESAYAVRDQVVSSSEVDMLNYIREVEEKPTSCQTFGCL